MKVTKTETQGRRGIPLQIIKIEIPNPLAVVQIFHGMGEHKERYIPFMEFLAKNKIASFVHDHRQHGESLAPGSEVGIFLEEDTFEDVIDDCNKVMHVIKTTYPNVPIFVLGHSMGSIIARHFIASYEKNIQGTIIMGTLPPISKRKALIPLNLAHIIYIFQKITKRSPFIASLLNKPLLKTYTEPRTQFDWISSDKEIVDKYVEDPLCGYPYNAKFYYEFIKELVHVNDTDVIFETQDIPLLFIAGANDPVGEFAEGVKQVRDLYIGHGFSSTSIEIIPKARHEILNELNKEHTYEILRSWITKQL